MRSYGLGIAAKARGAVFPSSETAAWRIRTLRTVKSGSWLGREHQGQGTGKEMRAVVLHLAFEGLGATEARSSAWADNGPSLGVSESLGYERNGEQLMLRRGAPHRHLAVRLDRATWEQDRRDDITIEGLDACLDMFGVSPSA